MKSPVSVLVASLLASWSFSLLAAPAERSILPPPPAAFAGQLAPKTEHSDKYTTNSIARAPAGAPNVLLIMTDDVGFGAVSTFGGPIPKPNLDRLAQRGLVYNRFHTAGICSPTRAALLTGRNHHAVGTGALVEMNSDYPGYTGIIPPSAATLARVLRDNGYNTAMFGKDHNIPIAQRSPAGPFDQWPTGRGFEHFYGFIFGDTNQFQPALYQGTQPLDSRGRDADYVFDRDLIDQAITWIHNQKAAAPDKPFFIYQAFGTAHAPQQVPAEWIARFRGKFDHGWDEQRERTLERQKALGTVPADTRLAARPAEIPAWDTLTATQKKIYARFMEVYAGMLAHQDHQIGRLLDELDRMGLADNTLVVYIEGDNGSAAETGTFGSINELADIAAPAYGLKYDEAWLAANLDMLGGPQSYAAIPAGWSFAMNAPFTWTKQVVSHLGGVRNGLVISWPAAVAAAGSVRTQYHHVIDVMPTILEAAGIPAPQQVDGIEQQRIDGTSMLYSFDDAEAPSTRRTQYYEVTGNRAIYHDGLLANTKPRNLPWNISRAGPGTDPTTYEWELYDLTADFSQSRNIADERPEQLRALQQLFAQEAEANQVYPIQNDGAALRARNRSKSSAVRPAFTYWGPDIRLAMSSTSPPIFWAPFRLQAEIEVPQGGADGVLFAAGSQFGGWSFYLHEGKPVVAAASSPLPGDRFRIAAAHPLPAGRHTLVFDVAFTADGGATVRIATGDDELVQGAIARRPAGMGGGGETFDTGRDSNAPVSTDYANEGVFNGKLEKVVITLQRR